MRFMLTEYIEGAMQQATYEKMEDHQYFGRIPSCRGVVAFSKTLKVCKEELRSALEDWIILGLKLGHRLPLIHGIDLNRKPHRERLEAV